MSTPQKPPKSKTRIASSIWALGFVSMLMDTSSEMIHSLLPLYLVTVLGASMALVGLIEGVAEATASVVKVFSGAISDWLGKRKFLAILGYGLAAFTKPIFPLAETVSWVITARFVDRIGKGIRGAPRDALIADLSPDDMRGASYGLRQSLDTIGAFVGPLLAIALMWFTANHFAIVFWVAVLPAFLSVLILFLFVKEPKGRKRAAQLAFPLQWSELKHLSGAYWLVIVIAGLFTLGRFSEAFLILKAEQVGLPLMWAPIVLVVMNIVYSLSAYPTGVASDKTNRLKLLMIGFLTLAAADFVLAHAEDLVLVFVGIALWGLHLGLTQGLLMTLIADTAAPQLRGTAFGIFHLITGIMLFFASFLAGLVWEQINSAASFQLAALFALLACLGLVLLRWFVPNIGATHLHHAHQDSADSK
jgi:MFS family permease